MSNSNKVNIAMIGCGQIAKAHLKSIENIPNAELVAVMDVVEEKARSMADQYNAKLYTSIESVLDDDSVDAVVLPLPHHLHCPVTIQAAKAGKHILVEKPMALNLGEAQQMVEAVEAANVFLMVGQSTRFRPMVWRAKEIIKSRKLGQMQQCICQRLWFLEKLSTEWRYSSEECGGLYLPIFASHDVDMILWLMDEKPVSVHSFLRSYTEVTDSESDGTINIELSRGSIVNLSFSMTSHISVQKTVLIGSEGTLLIDGSKLFLNNEEILLDMEKDQFTNQMREFVDSIIAGRQPRPSGSDVLPTIAVLDAAKESSLTNRLIRIGVP